MLESYPFAGASSATPLRAKTELKEENRSSPQASRPHEEEEICIIARGSAEGEEGASALVSYFPVPSPASDPRTCAFCVQRRRSGATSQ